MHSNGGSMGLAPAAPRGASHAAPPLRPTERPQLPAGLDVAAAAIAAAALPLPRLGPVAAQPRAGFPAGVITCQPSAGRLTYERSLLSSISNIQSVNLNGSMVIPVASAMGSGAQKKPSIVSSKVSAPSTTYGVQPRPATTTTSSQPGSTIVIGGGYGQAVTASQQPAVAAAPRSLPARTAAARGSAAFATVAAVAPAAPALSASSLTTKSGLAVRPARSPVPLGHRALAVRAPSFCNKVGSTGLASSFFPSSTQAR